MHVGQRFTFSKFSLLENYFVLSINDKVMHHQQQPVTHFVPHYL